MMNHESKRRSEAVPERRRNKLPNSSLSVNLKYLKLGYHYLVSNALYFFFLPLFTIFFTHFSTFTIQDITQLSSYLMKCHVTVIASSMAIVLAATLYFMSRPRKVYLVNFSCYKDEPAQMCSKELFLELSATSGTFTEESLAFKKKILGRSGFGQKTYGPKAVMKIPMTHSKAEAKEETEAVMFSTIDEVLAKTGVKPRDIDILVVNSGMFNPTPSLSAAIVNRYKLRGDIRSYNLGGMGCSAGPISIDLAKDLLQVHPDSYALVVSTENITANWYSGNNRSMLLTNCLFRVGGAAILLSNRSSDRCRSKYQLLHTLRTHKGADDKCYNCVFQKEDENQKVGVILSKELMAVAGEALKTNIYTLGPLVLPMSEQLLFLASIVARNFLKMKKMRPYFPDFKRAFEHFCIHAGGRGVLDEMEKNLKLSEWHMEPSRMTLYRFGNTSSSCLWYELAYSEGKGRIRKGDRVWQIGLGSGFKCNSAVWRALRTIEAAKEKNPWMDEIDQFPIEVPQVATIDVSF